MKFAGETTLNDFVPEEIIDTNKDILSWGEINPYIYTLQEGDIIFTETDWYLSSMLTPGKWTHVAIYL